MMDEIDWANLRELQYFVDEAMISEWYSPWFADPVAMTSACFRDPAHSWHLDLANILVDHRVESCFLGDTTDSLGDAWASKHHLTQGE